jgi:hypothetical protein
LQKGIAFQPVDGEDDHMVDLVISKLSVDLSGRSPEKLGKRTAGQDGQKRKENQHI